MKPDYDELIELLRIYTSELTDWHVQVTYLIGDGRLEEAANIMAQYNIAVHKLAGALGQLLPEPVPFLNQK